MKHQIVQLNDGQRFLMPGDVDAVVTAMNQCAGDDSTLLVARVFEEETLTPEPGKESVMPRAKKPEPGEQSSMFPELDDSPEHKALLKLAKAANRAKARRDALLSMSKEEVDGCMDKLKAKMHECKLKAFKHGGVKAKLIDAKEKVIVEVEREETDEE